MNTIKIAGIALLAGALVACGGSGGSGSNPSSQANASSVPSPDQSSASNTSVQHSSSSSESEPALSSESGNSSVAESSAEAQSSEQAPSSEAAASSVAGPAVSSEAASSEAASSQEAASSSAGSSSTGEFRAPKLEGYAAYAVVGSNTGVTGGADGPVYIVTTGAELNEALCGARRNNRQAPVTILVNGTINHANTARAALGCDTAADVIEIKNTSNVSIIGVGNNALFDEIGIHMRSASNIIIQNVHIRNVKKSGNPTSNGGDAIGMESGVNGVWIDHNWLEASGGEKDGYDSLLDMKAGVTNVTVSYNLFNDSSRGGLIGSSNGDDKNTNITFHHNWYKNIEQRTPLIRHAKVHMYNNYWSNENRSAMIHGINSRMHGQVLVEGNYFHNVNNPLIASKDSPEPGCWETNNDNILVDYIYTRTVANGQAHAVPDMVDGQMQSNCSVSVPYNVDMDPAADVPAIVIANAGTGKITVDTTGAMPVVVSGGGNSSSAGGSSGGSSSSAGGEVVVGDWTSVAMIMAGGHNKTSGSIVSGSNTQITANFNGGKIESSKEGFFFVYQEVTGNFTLTANLASVASQTQGNNQGQIGIILCATCEAGSSTLSASAKIGVTGNTSWGIIGEHRVNDGANRVGHNTVSPEGVTPGADLYFRIVRDGNTYTSFYSIDGAVNWAQKNTGTFSALSATVKVGFYGSKGHDSDNSFTFDNIVLDVPEED